MLTELVKTPRAANGAVKSGEVYVNGKRIANVGALVAFLGPTVVQYKQYSVLVEPRDIRREHDDEGTT